MKQDNTKYYSYIKYLHCHWFPFTPCWIGHYVIWNYNTIHEVRAIQSGPIPARRAFTHIFRARHICTNSCNSHFHFDTFTLTIITIHFQYNSFNPIKHIVCSINPTNPFKFKLIFHSIMSFIQAIKFNTVLSINQLLFQISMSFFKSIKHNSLIQ